ncbi:(3R)-hydroxymyristol acyl carrier protein dehydratase [Candidatus Desulfarcum epimagneticum]|uniref:3-hydroxyacyl-[acyl-carrier-protein] dehydratase FabZ n=1 Tax=uncultured Desulfobacteraceae bacterium TaxID=218296 RepID=A0A484HFK9_9BACT|nr:(3R)-hydroxymyristol acyl carrier protein dehydratase [uncultured Desulfobacteraceae bacterium]
MECLHDIRDIMTFLPHRYPFILVDRVLEIQRDQEIAAIKNVTINEPFFQGHFPGAPVMPGVLIMEALAQAGGILVLDSMPEEKKGSLLYFMGMDRVRFRRKVIPGDCLSLRVRLMKKRASAVKMFGEATVDGEKAAEGEMMASIGEKL